MSICRCGCGVMASRVWATKLCQERSAPRCRRCWRIPSNCSCPVPTATELLLSRKERAHLVISRKRGFAVTPEVVAQWHRENLAGKTYADLSREYKLAKHVIGSYVRAYKATLIAPPKKKRDGHPCGGCVHAMPSDLVTYECGAERAGTCRPLDLAGPKLWEAV